MQTLITNANEPTGPSSPHPKIMAECLDCQTRTPYHPTLVQCPHCSSQWLQARYDYDALRTALPQLLPQRPFDLWRYRELLPILDYKSNLSLGEGGTPLIDASNLGMMLGNHQIYVKDERQGPTSSFKDRQAAVNIAALKEAGITEAVLASTGNVAIAYSAYAARAGIKLWAFLTSLVPSEKMREVAIYGTQVVKVTGSYDEAKKLAAEFARQRGLYLERGARSIPSVEAMKTIAYEILEQLTALVGSPISEQGTISPTGDPTIQSDLVIAEPSQDGSKRQPIWRSPDWYIQAVSGGMGPLGVQKGFQELYDMGLIDRVPAIACIQTEGCSPMVSAWQKGLDVAEPIHSPRTRITTLATGDPGRTYTLLRQAMLGQNGKYPGGGCFESATDEEAYRAMHLAAKMEGLSVEPAAAVAFAGLIKLVHAGQIKSTDLVVVNCTGHTMPIEKEILGEGWARNLVVPSPSISETTASVLEPTLASSTPEEGLLAALNNVTVERYPSILIVDDTDDARRLVRRILQSQGNYTLHEASNGRQAVEMAHDLSPDLIILDLMMPEMDGFMVLDALKNDPNTTAIPVIVVTAKELTRQEKARLNGQIHTLMQKGEFMSDDLLDEVRILTQ